MKNQSKLKNIVTAALFAAIISVTTLFPHIGIGTAGGYIHIGDTFLYLAASILPGPYAMLAGGVGAAMADILSGSALWALPTLIIKPLMAACFTSTHKSILCRRNLVALLPAGLICIVGYYLAEALLFWNFIAPLYSIPMGILQPLASAVLYTALGAALDKAGMKRRLFDE